MTKTIFRFPDKLADAKEKTISKVRAAVVPVSFGAGASYVSSKLLQKGLFSGDTPEGLRSLVELGSPYFYFALGMDKRFSGRTFFDFEDPKTYSLNMELGFNWYLRHPSSIGDLPPSAVFRAVSSAPGNFVVYDCSRMQRSDLVKQVLAEMDVIYIVVDPLPSKLMEGQSVFDDLRASFPESKIVVNKFNRGIHKGELARFLGTSNYFTLDAVPYESLCKAEFNCNLI